MAIATERIWAKFFANGATPNWNFRISWNSKEDPESMRKVGLRVFSGRNSHKIAILEEKESTHNSHFSNEAQFFRNKKNFQINEIA